MNKEQQLKALVLQHLPEEQELTDWMDAIIDEACQTAIQKDPEALPSELLLSAQVGVAVGLQLFQALIKTGLEVGGQVTINLWGKQFVFQSHPGK